ncbi:hypothetical protein QTQ03_17985 [Micromonospora sp. WMMA1363]|uniref:hypothetical protein n=1 Tax=Micromonospora sp. WMMA1363 TaxID=3053985 RepID=UPI00259D2FE6|nr:hypothetical protein [Micromonospora sp. WMMA1363]MDM4721398.1 hypothetical protein [Micromonospora sp. WMMA1363]
MVGCALGGGMSLLLIAASPASASVVITDLNSTLETQLRHILTKPAAAGFQVD